MYSDDPMFSPSYGTDFRSGMESMYAMSGGVSLAPQYLTPSYTANMRPGYGGPMGFDMGRTAPFSTFGAAMTVTDSGATSMNPYYVSPGSYYQQAASDLTSRFGDSAAWVGQNLMTPFAAFLAANYVTTRAWGGAHTGAARSTMAGWQYAKHTVGGMFSSGGLNPAARNAAMAAAVKNRTIGTAIGSGVGRMAGAGIGAAMGVAPGAVGGFLAGKGAVSGAFRTAATTGRWGAAMGAGAGALVGGMAVPFAAAYALDAAVDPLWDSYIAVRQGTDAFSTNTFREYTGSSASGFGSRRVSAGRVGSSLAKDSARAGNDLAFNAELMDFGMQAGMYQDMSAMDTSGIAERTRQAAKQVKLLMQVANEPNTVEAIKLLTSMRMAGATGASADSLISRYGSAAGISGTAARRIMEGVGAQGQYLFQQSGLTPYVGQMQAASAYAGISNAVKSGLVSPAMLAMMGGREGATQNILQTTIGYSRTPYNMGVSLWGNQGGMMANLGNIGQQVVNDPLKAAAHMRMYGGMAASASLEDNPLAYMKQMIDQLQLNPMAMDSSGKVRVEALVELMGSQGMDAAGIHSQLALLNQYQDPQARSRARSAADMSYREQERNWINQQGRDYTQTQAMAYAHNISLDLREGKAGVAGAWGNLLTPLNRMSDNIAQWQADMKYGEDTRGGTAGVHGYNDRRYTGFRVKLHNKAGISDQAQALLTTLSDQAATDPTLLARLGGSTKASAFSGGKQYSTGVEEQRTEAIRAWLKTTDAPLSVQNEVLFASDKGFFNFVHNDVVRVDGVRSSAEDSLLSAISKKLPPGYRSTRGEDGRAVKNPVTTFAQSIGVATREGSRDAIPIARLGMKSGTSESLLQELRKNPGMIDRILPHLLRDKNFKNVSESELRKALSGAGGDPALVDRITSVLQKTTGDIASASRENMGAFATAMLSDEATVEQMLSVQNQASAFDSKAKWSIDQLRGAWTVMNTPFRERAAQEEAVKTSSQISDVGDAAKGAPEKVFADAVGIFAQTINNLPNKQVFTQGDFR
jgi:hypothetical protein